MPSYKHPVTIVLEDDTTWEASWDHRDLSKWEVSPFFDEKRKITCMRYAAWAASIREGKTELTWPKFDLVCIWVGAADEDEDDEDAVDPTRPAPSAEG